MFKPGKPDLTRRAFNVGLASGLGSVAAGLSPLQALAQDGLVPDKEVKGPVRRNISSFSSRNWRPYFANRHNGVILVDVASRVLHFWSEDGKTYKLYPTSVPVTEELTKRGRTRIVRKIVGPEWRPTPNMKKRNPEWPDYIGPGEDNPLGTHAMYLSWKYYRIHGTNDTRKIGRRSSNGCIGLYNEHISELFELAKVGTQVLLI
ncbi:MAG: L,D-transpeptidase [Paracoccaceae bacterium]